MAEGAAEPHWHAESGAPHRFLGSDEGAASAVVGACIAMVAMFLAAGGIGAAAFLWHRHRARNGPAVVQKAQVNANADKGKQAWPDPEVGGEQVETAFPDKASTSHPEAVANDKLSASVRLELCETLRHVLEEEISRGLKASGISDRLDRLEQQARDQQVLSGSLLPPNAKEDLDSTVKPQAWSGAADVASTIKKEPKEEKVIEQQPPRSFRDASTITDAQPENSAPPRSQLTLSPSKWQRQLPDPPEKGWAPIDQDRSLRASLTTVSRNLAKRDGQTQELHRQLRETQKDSIMQKQEASYAIKKLHDLLSDPTHAPQAQAVELQNLRERVDGLAARLADSKSSEMQWFITAKRQRAFFMQSERVAAEGVNVFRKHPAGELFLAPPPVYLEDDLDEDPRRLPWDIGTSHINPYSIDSWPFEPNACAQKCAVEPNLPRWEEEDGLVDSDDSEDADDSPRDGQSPERLELRLPQLPPESPESPYEDFDPPEPTGAPEPLPTSTRSL